MLFIIGNFICLIGTLLLMRRVLKNRNMLKDFDPLGSLLTFIPLVIFMVGYVLWHNGLATGFAAVTMVFWLVVSIFSIKGWLTKKGKNSKNIPKMVNENEVVDKNGKT